MSSIGRSIAGLAAVLALGTTHATPLATSASSVTSMIVARSVASTDLHTQTTRVWIVVRGLEHPFDIEDQFGGQDGRIDLNKSGYDGDLSDPNAAGEPGTLVLLGLGLVALALIRRRRSRK